MSKNNSNIYIPPEKRAQEPAKKERGKVHSLLLFLRPIVIAAIVALLINSFVIVNAQVISSSMENTVMTGDRVICSRFDYWFGDPERFDIIIFDFKQNGKNENYFKRVIGLPGEKVEIKGGKVYINDSPTPIYDGFTRETPDNKTFGPYYVPENEYFVMGDNRNHSIDSREWEYSFVKRSEVKGKARFVYFPNFKIIDYSDVKSN